MYRCCNGYRFYEGACKVCPSLRYGYGCNYLCNCHNGHCDKVDGTCDCTGTRSYGLYCNIPCQCQNFGECDPRYGSCRCQPNYWGRYCERSCIPSCQQYEVCYQYSGNCDCPVGKYGDKCEWECPCYNGARCHRNSGQCNCAHPWIGEKCTDCDQTEYYTHIDIVGGKTSNYYYCNDRCLHCYNGDTCNPTVPGSCQCTAGWTGDKCDQLCDEYHFGDNCQHQCQCDDLHLCNSVTGDCDRCKAGYRGKQCDIPCQLGTYGYGCKLSCNEVCGQQECHHVTGNCTPCPVGFHGDNCEKKCQSGFYGHNCQLICENCTNAQTCDNDKGCVCDSGWTGSYCQMQCPSDRFGSICQYSCASCMHDIHCGLEAGCVCQPGWIGQLCDIACDPGFYGDGCEQQCFCANGTTCDHVTGDCICGMEDAGENCDGTKTGYKNNGTSNANQSVKTHKTTILVVVLIILVIIGGIVGGVLIVMRKRMQKMRRETPQSDVTASLQRTDAIEMKENVYSDDGEQQATRNTTANYTDIEPYACPDLVIDRRRPVVVAKTKLSSQRGPDKLPVYTEVRKVPKQSRDTKSARSPDIVPVYTDVKKVRTKSRDITAVPVYTQVNKPKSNRSSPNHHSDNHGNVEYAFPDKKHKSIQQTKNCGYEVSMPLMSTGGPDGGCSYTGASQESEYDVISTGGRNGERSNTGVCQEPEYNICDRSGKTYRKSSQDGNVYNKLNIHSGKGQDDSMDYNKLDFAPKRSKSNAVSDYSTISVD
ncbi:uncharacterized protein LOC144448390 isoform X2 [Glandiceps talaboti]